MEKEAEKEIKRLYKGAIHHLKMRAELFAVYRVFSGRLNKHSIKDFKTKNKLMQLCHNYQTIGKYKTKKFANEIIEIACKLSNEERLTKKYSMQCGKLLREAHEHFKKANAHTRKIMRINPNWIGLEKLREIKNNNP